MWYLFPPPWLLLTYTLSFFDRSFLIYSLLPSIFWTWGPSSISFLFFYFFHFISPPCRLNYTSTLLHSLSNLFTFPLSLPCIFTLVIVENKLCRLKWNRHSNIYHTYVVLNWWFSFTKRWIIERYICHLYTLSCDTEYIMSIKSDWKLYNLLFYFESWIDPSPPHFSWIFVSLSYFVDFGAQV